MGIDPINPCLKFRAKLGKAGKDQEGELGKVCPKCIHAHWPSPHKGRSGARRFGEPTYGRCDSWNRKNTLGHIFGHTYLLPDSVDRSGCHSILMATLSLVVVSWLGSSVGGFFALPVKTPEKRRLQGKIVFQRVSEIYRRIRMPICRLTPLKSITAWRGSPPGPLGGSLWTIINLGEPTSIGTTS